MGQTLSEPVVEKLSEQGEDDRLYFGVSTMQGWRISMEDAHAAVLDLQPDDNNSKTTPETRVSFFGVYDGHGGDGVALFSGQNVHKIVAKQAEFAIGNFEKAMKDGFLACDRAILQDPKYSDEVSGCTASTAIVTHNKIFVANAGDSRTVLGVKGRAKPLSFDHKPQNEGEKARITAAGGFVDFGRVNGNLALSRAIGDFEFKKSADLPPEQQIVTSFPDVVIHELSDDDEFMVIACDGIWDCQSSQAVIEFVRRGIVEKQELQKICENMMDSCLAPSSENGGVGCDNMTMVIVAFLRGKTKEEWYEMVARRVSDGDGPCAPPEYAQPKNHGFRPSSHYANFEEEEAGPVKKYGVMGNTTREGGRIIMLGDGAEILTDSDDTEMFDYDEEEKDAEALDKDSSTPESKGKPNLAQDSRDERKSDDGAGSSKDSQSTDGNSSRSSLDAKSS
ncbi:Protein phosphatase 2C 2 [Orbilia brochopaga]|uniref:Protein phosphatase 2C homolog 2 n=1 Tax=Orbilia brochopaga TaxID=3140254 RepID=A0AAV9VAG4_9PEZI